MRGMSMASTYKTHGVQLLKIDLNGCSVIPTEEESHKKASNNVLSRALK